MTTKDINDDEFTEVERALLEELESELTPAAAPEAKTERTPEEEETPAPPPEEEEEEEEADDVATIDINVPPPVFLDVPDRDFDAELKSLKDERKALKAKYTDGDLDEDRYEEQLDHLEEKRADMLRAQAKAETAAEYNQAAARQAWEAAQLQFFAQAKRSGIDYLADPVRFNQFNGLLMGIGNDMINHRDNYPQAGKTALERDIWALNEAHRQFKASRATTPDQPTPSKTQPAAKPTAKKELPPRQSKPPDLKLIGRLPQADGPDDIGNEYADLMALEGDDYEDALERIAKNPAQLQRFIRAG